MITVNIIQEDGSFPLFRKSENESGFDLTAIEDVIIPANGVIAVDTGIKTEFPSSVVAKIESRSGLALKNISAEGGIIDSSYRGNLKVILRNCTNEGYQVKRGDRIGQLIFYNLAPVTIKVVEKLSETERGEKGFGSSGV